MTDIIKNLYKSKLQEEFKGRLLGIKYYPEEGIKITESQLKIYPPLVNPKNYNPLEQPQSQLLKKMTSLEENLNIVYDSFKIEPYFKRFFKKQNSLVFNNEYQERKEDLILSNLFDFSEFFDCSNVFLEPSNYEAFFNKKKENNSQIFLNLNTTQGEGAASNWDQLYIQLMLKNTKNLIQNFPNVFVLKKILVICNNHSSYVLSSLPFSPAFGFADTLNTFAFASAFIILTHPFIVLDLGVSSKFSIILQLTHSKLNSYFFEHISNKDLNGRNLNQFVNCVPYIIDKSVLNKILSMYPPDLQNKLFFNCNLYKEQHLIRLFNICNCVLSSNKSVFIDVTNSVFLISDILKRNV